MGTGPEGVHAKKSRRASRARGCTPLRNTHLKKCYDFPLKGGGMVGLFSLGGGVYSFEAHRYKGCTLIGNPGVRIWGG